MSFTLDPFQKKALDWIEKDHSVLVSAPTGSGKTLIAEAAIKKARQHNKSVVYTAPIKALSNQKYRDFRAQYGSEEVGILTGDVSINPDAPILIMTTEIYRNCIFENSDRIQNMGWVIFDEIHYLDDVDRGTVWEEALLFTPKEIKILALSATCPNIDQLAEWMAAIHDRPIKVVEETHRPVPLHFYFQCQGKFFSNAKKLKGEGYLNLNSWRVHPRKRRKGFSVMRAKPNRLDQLLRVLESKKQFPAIYFAFGRRRTEYLADEAIQFDFLNAEEKQQALKEFDHLLKQYDLKSEKTAIDMRELIERGIAYHHAGMLPTLKEVIEQLFTSKLIKMIFTTETFALGINMPARSVIFDELEKFYGTGFKKLTTRDFYQMAGRAGRRGMDDRGEVYIRINPHHIAFNDISPIIHGKAEPIHSQLNTTYATLLNLYRDLGSKLTDIYPKTFHFFQSHKKRRRAAESLIDRKLELLRELGHIDEKGLTEKGEFASSLFGYELYMAELKNDTIFDDLNECKLNVLMSGLIFEPRKGMHHPKLTDSHKKLRKVAEHYAGVIYRKEHKYNIHPYTKAPHFHLAGTVEAWTAGMEFDKLFRITSADEGELVRHFRMIIQLLRELQHSAHVPDKLASLCRKARERINRDVVDAEKQLRV